MRKIKWTFYRALGLVSPRGVRWADQWMPHWRQRQKKNARATRAQLADATSQNNPMEGAP